MKKIFTLIALMACFMGAKAEEKVDLEIDYSTATSWNHGWLSNEDLIKFEDGCIHFSNETASANFWDYQFQVFGVSQLEYDTPYTITLKIKGSVAQDLHASFSGSATPGTIPVTTDWQTVVLEGCQDDPNAQYFAGSGQLLIQCGDYVGDWWISYVKITHEEAPAARPVEWVEQLTNGDAEAEWPAWSLEETDGLNANWRGDRTGEICAWSIVRGKNYDTDQTIDPTNTGDNPVDGKPRPFPCQIEAEEGNPSNHVFVVHASAADNEIESWQAWDNQFWIQSPKAWKSGSQIKLHFRYKASREAKVETQYHNQWPSKYLFYQGPGNLTFSTEWQEFDQIVTIPDAANGAWSVAFNLNPDVKEAMDFYFDDLSWQAMKLDEGYFVAASNADNGIAYDYDNAIEFTDAGDGLLTATIGTAGKKNTWVNEVQISTVRGHRGSFLGATIKPSGVIDGTEDGWLDYTAASNAKIKLPAAGVYTIYIDPEGMQIVFVEVEGDEIAIKEPVAIVTNETENVVNATERDWRGKDNDGNPIEEEVGEGQPWDNQFWIAANRNLETDEVTVIKFQYKATKAAKTSTQAHKVGDDGKPCTYLNWEAIGDVNFTEEWQDFEKEFKVPAGDNGMRSIVFNMSEIKEANDYYIKNVQWYVKDATLEAEGKTMENLINETGADNFWIKVNKGAPEQPTAINGVVAKAAAGNGAIYNLAGQRVNAAYKGLVIKDGKKYIAK